MSLFFQSVYAINRLSRVCTFSTCIPGDQLLLLSLENLDLVIDAIDEILEGFARVLEEKRSLFVSRAADGTTKE